MSNLNLQHELETYYKKPLAQILADQFAKHHTVKIVAESLDVDVNTVRNWLYFEGQYHVECRAMTPQQIGRYLAESAV